MPQLITVGNQLIRVNPAKNCIELSSSNGALWISRSRMGSMFGRLKDIAWYNNQLYALTETGLWRSANMGACWGQCGSGRVVENLVAIMDGGRYLYGLSSDGGFMQSYNGGADWVRKG